MEGEPREKFNDFLEVLNEKNVDLTNACNAFLSSPPTLKEEKGHGIVQSVLELEKVTPPATQTLI